MREDLRALMAGERRGWPAACQRLGLRCASLPYGLAVDVRNRLFDGGYKLVHRAGVPVISVGNLTVGGTGKTPCVEYVARRLLEWGRKVAILSRGYGSQKGPNDEAMVLEQNLPGVPHLQGADRVALAKFAVEQRRSDVLVLDDGFQHRRLARDLDLVLLDATAPWGYGHLLPRGLLRESPWSLRRAGLIMLTRCDQVKPTALQELRDEVSRLAPETPVVETSHRPAEWIEGQTALQVMRDQISRLESLLARPRPAKWIDAEQRSRPLEELAGRSVAAFCGIGNPEAFRRTLLNLGLNVKAFRVFPDHHAYSSEDMDALRDWATQEAAQDVVVTTQKDLVKLRLTRLGSCELLALRIQLHIHAGQDALDLKLKEALG